MEWPLAGPPADLAVEPVRRAGRGRLPVVRRDLFLDESARLTEQERALISAMLRTLVDQVADELRVALPPDLLAHAEADRDSLAGRLWRDGSLDRPSLIALLLRRADQQMVASACQRAAAAGAGIIEELVGDDDGRIASAAMALAVARGRRRDRFGRVGVLFDDLPAAEAVGLANMVAAGMRRGLPDHGVVVDEALATAAQRLLQRHDEGRRTDVRAWLLAAALVDVRGDDDKLVAALAEAGDAELLAAMLAVRAGIEQDTAWALLIEAGPRDAMLAARLAGIRRASAAAIVAALTEPLAWGDPTSVIAMFDSLGGEEVDSARRWWRLPAHYRDSLERPGGGDGQSRA